MLWFCAQHPRGARSDFTSPWHLWIYAKHECNLYISAVSPLHAVGCSLCQAHTLSGPTHKHLVFISFLICGWGSRTKALGFGLVDRGREQTIEVTPCPQAVRLESVWTDRVRYMVVVYTSGRQDTEENILLGVDFSSKER